MNKYWKFKNQSMLIIRVGALAVGARAAGITILFRIRACNYLILLLIPSTFLKAETEQGLLVLLLPGTGAKPIRNT
jgi:hypothetical protein